MLFILLSLIFGIIFMIIGIKTDYTHEIISLIAILLSLVLFVVFIFSSIVAVINNVTKDADVAQMQQTYQSLIYQLENIDTLYGNSHANDKKALYDEIRTWNEHISSNMIKHNNLWVNWLYPIDYTQFKLIELK